MNMYEEDRKKCTCLRNKDTCTMSSPDNMFEQHFADAGEENIPQSTDVFLALQTFLATGSYPDWATNAKNVKNFKRSFRRKSTQFIIFDGHMFYIGTSMFT